MIEGELYMCMSSTRFSAITAVSVFLIFGAVNTIDTTAWAQRSGYEICKEELAASFKSAYGAGKTTAISLNYGYSKMSREEQNSLKSIFFKSKSAMVKYGVAFISTAKPELRDRVSCYISAYEKLNTGFISGFSDNLTPELRGLYISLPLL